MIVQVVESHLVDGLGKVFYAPRVLRLSAHEVRALAGDSGQVYMKRQELGAQLARLEQGRFICTQIAIRAGQDLVSLHR